jgi:hypothetical protein
MPIYMIATLWRARPRKFLAAAHQLDIKVQSRYDCKCASPTGLMNIASRFSALIDAPSREAVQDMHRALARANGQPDH